MRFRPSAALPPTINSKRKIMSDRKLFCEISPLTYKISVFKCCMVRRLRDMLSREKFAKVKSADRLPVVIYEHSSLIRRTLGNVDPVLQNNKAVNLALSCPKVSGIIVYPGETFSFWKLVGACRAKDGYKEGLTISNGKTAKGVGGGMCQFTNLIHWMVLHTPLEITEHHHHDRFDLFPDCGRKVPFGTGTSIMYNYLDYRFKNTTTQPWQIIVWTDDKYLYGEIRTTEPLNVKYHIHAKEDRFVKEEDGYYRVGRVVRNCIDKADGRVIKSEVIRENHAKVMYEIDKERLAGDGIS